MKAFAMSWLLAAGLLAQAAGARAADSPRQQQTMDFGWRFALGDPAGAQAAGFDDSKWQAVDLPHDWSIHLAFDKNAPAGRPGGYLPAGIGWYRKSFRVPDSCRGRLVSVEFDGIREHGEVWINGHSLGQRPYGYTSVVYDMTPYLKFGDEDNVLALNGPPGATGFGEGRPVVREIVAYWPALVPREEIVTRDRKSTRLNSSHLGI